MFTLAHNMTLHQEMYTHIRVCVVLSQYHAAIIFIMRRSVTNLSIMFYLLAAFQNSKSRTAL